MIPKTQYELARQIYINDEDAIACHGGQAFDKVPEWVQQSYIWTAGRMIEALNDRGVTLTAKGD